MALRMFFQISMAKDAIGSKLFRVLLGASTEWRALHRERVLHASAATAGT
jgi:hypothetical protein